MEKTIFPGSVSGEVEPPSSKSYAQRVVAADYLSGLAAGAEGVCGGGEAVCGGGREAEGAADRRSPELSVSIARGGVGKEAAADEASKSEPGASDCDDIASALRVVEALRSGADTIDIGESGLCARMFAPIAALSARPVTITGRGSILKRPMGMVIGPLRELGVEVDDEAGFLPITVRGPLGGGVADVGRVGGHPTIGGRSSGDPAIERTSGDRTIEIDGSVSSQFLTGLLMALPLAEHDTTVRVRDLASRPYIDMTMEVMERYGVEVDHRDYEEFYVPGGQCYTLANFVVEGDWSAAACLLVAGAVAGRGEGVTVRNLRAASLQADAAIIGALSLAGARVEQDADSVRVVGPVPVCRQSGANAALTSDPGLVSERGRFCADRGAEGEDSTDSMASTEAQGGVKGAALSRQTLRAFFFDATDCPDLFPALAALASACDGTSTIVGTKRLIHKESNRAEAIRTELGKLGIEVDLSEENVMRVVGVGSVLCRVTGVAGAVYGHAASHDTGEGTVDGRVEFSARPTAPLGGAADDQISFRDMADTLTPDPSPEPIVVDSHGDHRIAMMLAVAALRASVPVTITDAECVAKSYARFWNDFEALVNG